MEDVRKMTIGDKLRAVRLEKGFSQRDLQEKSGVERNFLSLVENNHRSPSFKTLVRIAQALDVTVGYITDYDKSLQEAHPKDEQDSNFIKTLSQILVESESKSTVLDYTKFFPTPIINEKSFAADLNKFEETDIEDYVFVSSEWMGMPLDTKRYRCVWIKDEHKALPPIIEAGSLVCVDSAERDPHKLEGEIVAFQDKNGGCNIKRLRFQGEHILGLPERAMHQPPLIIPANKKDAILGKVVWCWSKFGK